MNEPTMRSAEEWLEVQNCPDVFNNEKPYGYEESLCWLREIQQEAIAYARYKALTEAAELAHKHQVSGGDRQQTYKDLILKLRDTPAKEGK